jgi:hypothetical protein
MGVLLRGPAVLFDALLYDTVRHREHLIYEIGKAVVFNVARCILGRVDRAS